MGMNDVLKKRVRSQAGARRGCWHVYGATTGRGCIVGTGRSKRTISFNFISRAKTEWSACLDIDTREVEEDRVTAGSQMACADHVEECTRTLEDECEPQKHNRRITGQGLRPLLALSRARLNGFSTVWSTRNTKKTLRSLD